jgi:hypothetical protein
MKKLFRFFVVTSIALLALYAAAGFSGKLCRSDTVQDGDEFDPNTVRTAPGGYRSMSLWHVGLHGGK